MFRRFTTPLFLCLLILAACGDRQPATPAETFKTYVKAYKKKDIRAMKMLLSDATIKMHEKQAKAQNTSVDEIINSGRPPQN